MLTSKRDYRILLLTVKSYQPANLIEVLIKYIKLKQSKNSNAAPQKKQEEQQLLAEIKTATAQFAAGLGVDNAVARVVMLERLAKRG